MNPYLVAVIGAIGTVLGILTTYWLTRSKQEFEASQALRTKEFDEEQRKRAREFEENQKIFDRHESRIKYLEAEHIKCMEEKADLAHKVGEALGQISGLTSTVQRLETTVGKASERAATAAATIAATNITEKAAEKAAEVAANKITEIIKDK